MNDDRIVKMLQDCIYRPNPISHQKVSIASLKDAINRISGKHIYCDVETRLSKLKKEDE